MIIIFFDGPPVTGSIKIQCEKKHVAGHHIYIIYYYVYIYIYIILFDTIELYIYIHIYMCKPPNL